jgi:hypothetical protein
MFTIFITIAISAFIVMMANLMSLGPDNIALMSKKSYKLVFGTAIGVCLLVVGYSAFTYPGLEQQSVYVNNGRVEQIQIIGGVSKYSKIRITTDKITTTVRAGQYPNVYVGAQIGLKYKISGGMQTTFNCIDGKCYSHSTCEWNMGCWKRALTRFKD